MTDFSGLPLPEGAPDPGGCVRLEHPEKGLARLVLDPPHRPKLAVFDVAVLRDLDLALDAIEKDASLTALVIAGRSPLSFAGGADVEGIAEVTDPELARNMVSTGQKVFQRIHALSKAGGGKLFVVAAAGGPVPGGACEICLACDRIVLADSPKTRIGLPEVKLGILPAWGGSQRLPRRVGVPAALDAILSGRLFKGKKAKRMGLVDRLTPPEYLERISTDIAMGRSRCPRRSRGWKSWLVDKNPLVGALISSQVKKKVMAQTHGHYPAPLAVLPLIVRAPRTHIETGLRGEVDAVTPLAVNSVTKSLVGLFLRSEDAKKLGVLADGTKAAKIERAAVIGAGVMGAGIASVMAQKKVAVRLRDLDQAQLDAAVITHQLDVAKQKKRRRLVRHEADAALDRLEVTTTAQGFGRCELVVEAVAERLNVKCAVLGEMAELMGPDAILATNTSSLSVDAIAAELPHPERVVGMHFFNPVPRMPLVEIVRGAKTSDEVVARTAQLAIDLGKTPVVTRDVAGFLVNRVLGPYLDEAVRLVSAGVDPEAIDKALLKFGMPMGPCELVDEVGLDIAVHAAASLEAAYGTRMQASKFLAPMVEAGELGKKTGKGLYLWKKDERGRPKKQGRNPRASSGGASLSLTDTEITDRLVLAMVNEAASALREEVVAGPRELDLATVFGTGFAPFRGGVLSYADRRGLKEINECLGRLELGEKIQPGERTGRFSPDELLQELAREDGTFHGSKS